MNDRRAFTLVELVLVLGILSLLSLLAVRSLSRGQSESKWRQSEKQLRELQGAITGDAVTKDGTSRDSNGDVYFHSFVSDIGRLPRAWSHGNDPTRFTLAELFVNDITPDGTRLPDWGIYEATSNNTRSATLNLGPPETNGVTMAFGWRGPYLNATFGAGEDFLHDGWGNAFVTEAADFAQARLLPQVAYEDYAAEFTGTLGDAAALTNGFEIGFIRHLGADGLEEMDPVRMFAVTNSPEFAVNRDGVYAACSNAFVRIVEATLKVADASAYTGFGLRVYAPDPENERGGFVVFDATNSHPKVTLAIPVTAHERLTVGSRIVTMWAVAGGQCRMCEEKRQVELNVRGCKLKDFELK